MMSESTITVEAAPPTGWDPVTFSLVLNRFQAIVEEMTLVLERSAWTSILALIHDYSCAIYDARYRQVCVVDGLPIHTTSMQLVVRAIAEAFEGDVKEGDVFACNDPYSGNTHIGDLVVVAPVFSGERLVFWSVSKGHQLDTGAPVPSSVYPRAENVWQEGVTVPPTKIFDAGEEVKGVLNLYYANVRYAGLLKGDLSAQIGSVNKGAQRLVELCDEYGTAEVLDYVDAVIGYADRRMRREIEAMPKGVFKAEGWVDSDGGGRENVPVKVAVTVDHDRVTVDYSGSAEQSRGGINGTLATAMAAGTIPFLYYIDPDIPHNEGCIQRVEVVAPEGSICNAKHPASTSLATIVPSDLMQDLVNKAMVEAMPERVPAGGTRNCNMPYISGGSGDGGWGFELLNSGGGAGASHGTDGWPLCFSQAALGGMKIFSIEQLELLYPVLIERAEIEMDSMGMGEWIGGPGVVVVVRPVDGPMTVIGCGDGCANPPHGSLGGTPGIGGGQYVESAAGDARLYFSAIGGARVPVGDVWVGVSTGGGGFGRPEDRPVEKVQADLRDGFISRDVAEGVFGLVLTGSGVEVDREATEIARQRLGQQARPSVVPNEPAASSWLEQHMRAGDSYAHDPLFEESHE